ncbi:MAG: glycosyltransferase family 9 protein [Gemmatimonadaceae bacterium]
MENGQVSRILVIELWNIGDIILAMPFLARLRHVFPHASVTLLSRSFASELFAGTGLVDEFITADLAWTPADGVPVPRRAARLFSAARALRKRKFDLAFSSRPHARERFLMALASADRRVGIAIGKADSLLTDRIAANGSRGHKTNDWLNLLAPFGGGHGKVFPRLYVSQAERFWATEYLKRRGVGSEDQLVGIHPGASLPAKRWPIERFRDTASEIAKRPGVRVLAFAEPSGYGGELFDIPGVVGARVGLRQLIALIERCKLLVCNDSGPMHIAGALGVPTVAMFGSGIDEWFAPLGEGHEILRAPSENVATRGGLSGAVRRPDGIATSEVIDAVGRILLSDGRR